MVRPGATIMRVEAGPPHDHSKAKLVITPLVDDVQRDVDNNYDKNGVRIILELF